MPLVIVVGAYPFGVRVAVLADVDRARSVRVCVAAVVCHGRFAGVLRPLEMSVHRALTPVDVANLALNHRRQTRFNVVA